MSSLRAIKILWMLIQLGQTISILLYGAAAFFFNKPGNHKALFDTQRLPPFQVMVVAGAAICFTTFVIMLIAVRTKPQSGNTGAQTTSESPENALSIGLFLALTLLAFLLTQIPALTGFFLIAANTPLSHQLTMIAMSLFGVTVNVILGLGYWKRARYDPFGNNV